MRTMRGNQGNDVNPWLEQFAMGNDDDDYMNYPNTTGIMNVTAINDGIPAVWDSWNPPHALRVSRFYYSMIAIYMSFLFVCSFSFNMLVLLTAYHNRSIRTPLNYIVINLTVADLLAVLSSNTLNVMANVAGHFFAGKWMCTMEGYIASVGGIAGLMSIAVMAFERFFVICKPFGPVRFNEKHAIIGIAFTWIYSILWNTPPMIFWDGYEAEGIGTNCAPNYFVTEPGKRMFIVMYFVWCFVVPFFIIAISYTKLIMKLREMKKATMVQSSRGVSADEEVTKMVVVMVFAFCFCWTPYAVVSMYTVITYQTNYALSALPAFFAKSATVYNPLIYIGLNKQFRDATIRYIFNGKHPWAEDVVSSSMAPSSMSAMTTVSTNKVGPA
uniref:medium-wave-sensitive opsin 1-like n=1 Tax=Styela clava TaxID=7725 RepID=UPI0019399014|nr:medium-wave-sensitive opsin 1-like [Styela clava]